MSFWIQHGHGKSDKIDRILSLGLLDGVVFSPANEDRPSLKATIDDLRAAPGIRLVLDPQLYVHTISGGTATHHKSHGLEVGGVHWSADTKAVRQHVKEVIAANTKLGTDLVVTPTPLQSSFTDAWASLALQYARGVAAVIPGDRVLVSVVLEESGLDVWDTIADWLDIVTQLEVAGFYVVIARASGTYPGTAWKAPRLANLLRLIYRLNVVNEYEVVLGYSEVEGLAAVAIGAGMATGWSYRLRRFAEGQWQPGGFGQPPTPRIFSERLLSSITSADAQSLLRSGRPELVGATAAERTRIEKGGWGTTETRTQYLEAMARSAHRFSVGSPDARLDRLGKALARARSDLAGLSAILPAAPTYDARLEPYSVALRELRANEGLAP